MKPYDMTGERFGKLTVIEPTSERRNGSAVWKCRCDCGGTRLVSRDCLVRGKTISCGCMQKLDDLSGQRFGRLTVLYKITGKMHVMYHCRCDCGNECDIRATQLRNGIRTFCGQHKFRTELYADTKSGYTGIRLIETKSGVRYMALFRNQSIGTYDEAGGSVGPEVW